MFIKFTFKLDDSVIAEGHSTMVMAYDFQKAFIESIGPTAKAIPTGKFITLQDLLDLEDKASLQWSTESVDGKIFSFQVEKDI